MGEAPPPPPAGRRAARRGSRGRRHHALRRAARQWPRSPPRWKPGTRTARPGRTRSRHCPGHARRHRCAAHRARRRSAPARRSAAPVRTTRPRPIQLIRKDTAPASTCGPGERRRCGAASPQGCSCCWRVDCHSRCCCHRRASSARRSRRHRTYQTSTAVAIPDRPSTNTSKVIDPESFWNKEACRTP